jgi:small-conductance mechanosensitive channel
MREKNQGFLFGGLLLLFFLVFIFRESLLLSIIDNYTVLSEKIILLIPKLLIIIIIILIAKGLISFISSIMNNSLKYFGNEKDLYSAKAIVRYLIWFLAILAMLSVFIGNLGVWLTSVGLIGFGITFALQKPILNFVGWITIMFNKTYSIGDRIMVGDVRGDVLDIQMMYTVMDGLLPNTDELSGKIITIPNELVLTGSMTNFTKTGEYLWNELSVDITYESNWVKAEKLLKDITFEVVNKYVGLTKYDKSDKDVHMERTINTLKDEHKETDSHSEKALILRKLAQLKAEKEKIDTMKKSAMKDIKKEPIVRVELEGSSIGLNVRYLAHYKNLRIMKSEINSGFLIAVAKARDIDIAYPHLQIIQKKSKK